MMRCELKVSLATDVNTSIFLGSTCRAISGILEILLTTSSSLMANRENSIG